MVVCECGGGGVCLVCGVWCMVVGVCGERERRWSYFP